MGIFILLIIILGLFSGILRKELALSLSAAAFLTLWVYCLIMTLLCALIKRGQAFRISARIIQREIYTGDQAEAVFSGTDAGKIEADETAGAAISHNAGGLSGRFRMPGIVTRFRLLLCTADGRRIQRDFAPGGKRSQPETFTASERGAYFSAYDEFAVFDIFGLFCFVYRIPCEAGYRLLVCPRPAPESLPVESSAGGTEHPAEFQIRRSDSLIDHRPYIPGDDPRRINWKLYGHGNELFVREGENEPPPHSRMLILIDSQYDSMLYTAEAGRQGIDLLCEQALACALELMSGGIDVFVSYSGVSGILHGGTSMELTALFAGPAAIRWAEQAARSGSGKAAQAAAELPTPPSDCGIIIFALPRVNAGVSALNRFLDKTVSENKGCSSELFFLYKSTGKGGIARKDDDIDEAAQLCADFYRRRAGLRVRLIKANS